MQEIILILDRSGSMSGKVGQDAVKGYKSFIKEQKNIGPANLTVVMFDHEYEIFYEGPLNHAPRINHWPARGMTALYDAIGRTFNHVKWRFSREKPEKVIMGIFTDGLENSSKEFKHKDIKALITEHENKYGWNVIYFGAEDLGVATAIDLLGIQYDRAFKYDSNNTDKGYKSFSSTVSSLRS